MVVPSVRIAGTTGDFHLSLYFDAPLHSVNIKRIDEPTEKCKFTYLMS